MSQRRGMSQAKRRLASLVILLAAGTLYAGGTKTVSGELHGVKDRVLSIQKIGLFSKGKGVVEIQMNDATKVTGQLAPGMHIKVKYKEENGHKIALEVETQPAYASKEAKKAAGKTHK
jgi:hypothetical protein